jgi:hypothetical protein
MDAALNHRPDECPQAEKALLSVPCWSMNEVSQDIGGMTKGLHLREQLCSQNTAKDKAKHQLKNKRRK